MDRDMASVSSEECVVDVGDKVLETGAAPSLLEAPSTIEMAPGTSKAPTPPRPPAPPRLITSPSLQTLRRWG